MSKRKKFIATSVLLAIGFVGIQFLPEQYRLIGIGGLSVLTSALFFWSLREGLGLNMTLLTLVIPIYFTLGVGLFWFLLPSSVFARIPVVLFYGIGIYALCLTANIYTVSTIRTIALLRAARGVGFVLTLVTFFLMFDAILSLHLPVYFSTLLVFLLSFPVFLQGLWSVQLEKKVSYKLVRYSIISSLGLMEISLALYFWPLTVVVGSLFLTVTVYMLLGLSQAELEGRLFSQTIRDYLILGVIVFLGMFLATRWG